MSTERQSLLPWFRTTLRYRAVCVVRKTVSPDILELGVEGYGGRSSNWLCCNRVALCEDI